MALRFSQFSSQAWPAVKQRYDWLWEWRKKTGEDEVGRDGLWRYLADLRVVADSVDGDESNFAYLDKYCLGLLEIDLADRVIAGLAWLENAGANSPSQGVVADDRLIDNHEIFSSIGFGRKTLSSWSRVYFTLDAESQPVFRQRLAGLLNDILNLVEELDAIALALGVSRSAAPYSWEQWRDLQLKHPLDLERARLVVTLRDLRQTPQVGSDFYLFLADMLPALAESLDNEKVGIYDAIIAALLMDFLYGRLNKTAADDQGRLWGDFFYKAIMVGIPVRRILRQYLADVDDVMHYAWLSANIAEILEQNTERVELDIAKGTTTQFKDLLARYAAFSESVTDAFEKEKFVENIYHGQPRGEIYVGWLRETLSVHEKIKNGTLIDWFKERNFGEREAFERDLAKLAASYGFGGKFVNIAEYYRQEEPRVKLAIFLKRLGAAVDINAEDQVDRLLRLSAVLQERGFLPAGEDLIIFDVDAGKFIWNDKALK